MKKSFLVMFLVLLLWAAPSAFAADLDYSITTGNVVKDGDTNKADFTINVPSGGLNYAGVEFAVRLGENIEIERVSYDQQGSTIGPQISKGSSADPNVWFFSVYGVGGNVMSGDLVCKVEISYTGSSKITVNKIERFYTDETGMPSDESDIGEEQTTVLATDDGLTIGGDPPPTPNPPRVGSSGTRSNNGGSSDNSSSDTSAEQTEEEPAPVDTDDTDVSTSGAPAVTFDDVPYGHWARSHVLYMAQRGYILGRTGGTFAPEDFISRAEFVTILARMSGDSLLAYSDGPFADVAADAYYAQAVGWATHNGVTKGTSETTFSPDALITRQEISAMLARYATAREFQFPQITMATDFYDGEQIHDYAREAVQVMQQAEILNGYPDGTFRPLANATRAEAAKMLALVYQLMNE